MVHLPRILFHAANTLALALFYCLIAGTAFGQVTPGMPSFSAYDSHEVDTIDLMNNNIVLNAPVMSKSGAFPFSYRLAGNFYVYYNSGGSWASQNGLYAMATGSTLGSLWGAAAAKVSTVTCPDGIHTTSKWTNWRLISSDLTNHNLPTADFTDLRTDGSGLSCLTGSGFTDQVTDGSGYTITAAKNVTTSIYDRSGTLIAQKSVKDGNGNKISMSGTSTITVMARQF
jgi:hypothetical protein